jgi:sulfonate transport system substrate-binding protein
MSSIILPRRRVLQWFGAGFVSAVGTGAIAQGCAPAPKETVNVGYWVGGVVYLLNQQNTLDQALASVNATANWTQFPSGPPLLEGINTKSIDFGPTGNSPPIFAQASGIPFVYVASSNIAPKHLAILVTPNSPIQKIEDLKGKKVAFVKGTPAHYLVIQALRSVGLDFNDIEPAYLPPADGGIALTGGSVDAWSIWNPLNVNFVDSGKARVLADGETIGSKVIYSNRLFYLARKEFAEKHPKIIQALLDEIRRTDEWAQQNPRKAAEVNAPAVKLSVDILEKTEQRLNRGVLPITDEIIAEQQAIADTYYQLGLIPKQVAVKEAVWTGA